jgi:DNA polymerase III epsilon subunit-like protein
MGKPSDTLIVIDVESSGIDPAENSILSIGAVDFGNPGRRFYEECRMRHGARYEQESLRINGFSAEGITSGPKPFPETIVADFCKWAEGTAERTPAGHNVHFDLSFLYSEIRRCGIRFSLGHRNVDTHTLTYAHLLSRGISPPMSKGRTDKTSDYVFEYVGIGSEPRPHRAINGAMMEAEALSRLIYGSTLLEEYAMAPIPPYLLRAAKTTKDIDSPKA